MKKLLFAAVCILLQAAACVFCVALAETEYAMTAVYLEDEQALSVSLDVRYDNETGQALDGVTFNLFANLFRRESTLPYDNKTLTEAFPFGYAPSGIEFTSVRCGGAPARYSFMGTGENFMRVTCSLEPGQRAEFHFDYTLLLSQNRAFQGCGDDVRLLLFYPSVCVWDEGYVLEPASRAAWFLYAEKADFDLTLYLPEGYGLCSGADIQRLSGKDGYDRYQLTLKDATELGIVASRRFYTYEGALPSGHTVRVCGNNRSKCKNALRQAVSALTACEAWFGPLPYAKTDIALSTCCQDLSLPGLIVANENAENIVLRTLCARQYFGCAVVTDPDTDPFLSYGVSCYAALLSLKREKGEKAFRDEMIRYIQPALKMTVPGSLTPDSRLSRFGTVYDFDVVVIRRGAAVLHEICLAMGEENFLAALGRYYEAGQNGICTIEDFAKSLGGYGEALVAWLMTIDDYAQHEGDIY